MRGILALFVFAVIACNSSEGQYSLPDSGGDDGPRNLAFTETCEKDAECASGKCVLFGTKMRCSRVCDSNNPCPALSGWICNNQSVCECALGEKQPDVCNVDGDCNNEADKIPTDETCNNEDDDCNNVIDDVAAHTQGATKYFQDSDEDGYGDPSVSKWSCSSENGWVETGDDCDDTRKEDHPGAQEVCGDTHDNDCDMEYDDEDICGKVPITVPDVTNNQYPSATLISCGQTVGIDKSVDITEILGKQDSTALKFTVRLQGAPVVSTCSTYKLLFGDPVTGYNLMYIYRLVSLYCGSMPTTEVYYNGQLMSSGVVTGFNAADPGHVSFIISKDELYQRVSKPTFHLKACTNAVADLVKDLTDCTDDVCETPVHR